MVHYHGKIYALYKQVYMYMYAPVVIYKLSAQINNTFGKYVHVACMLWELLIV